jgi:hypothetical protein
MYNRTDLIKFSDLILNKLAPAILMAKVSEPELSDSVKQIMIEVLNNIIEKERESRKNRNNLLHKWSFI